MYKKSKNIAVDMLPKTFKGAKCKTSLKLAMSRIKLMRNKKGIQVKQMRRDLAQLLEAGQEQTARIRVEHVIREEKTLSAYELIDIYCELIVARLPIIESQKSCPIDLREAIAGVVFASPRCADIPELMDVRKQFLAKYGKEFIASALEVRPDCGVSRLLVEKLSARAPDGETKVKVMTSIAEEHNIKWDPKSFEDQLQKPNEDLLAGPNTFASVNQMPVKSSNFSAPPSSMNEPNTRMSQNDIPSKATGFNASSAPNINTPSTSVPSVSHSKPDKMEGSSAWQEVNSANQMGNGSLNRQNWNMEFKDATSAAQAAAESAERASMAARAAAELARRGSASYDMNDGLERSEFPKAKDEYSTKESLPMPYNEVNPSQGMQMRRESRKIDEVSQASSRTEGKETYDGYAGVPRSSGQSLYHSSEISGRHDHLEVSQKVDERAPVGIQSSISKSEPLVQNYKGNQDEYDDYAEEIRNDNYSESDSRSSFGDDTRWNSNSQMLASYEEKSEIGAREGSFGGGQPVFDDYGFDEDDQLLNTFSSQQEEKQFRYLPTKDQFSPKQHESSFTGKDRSPQRMFETTESHPKDFVETNKKGNHSPHFDDNSAAFDDYDDHNYEGEDVFDKIMREEVMEPSNLPFDQKNSSKSSLSARSSQEPDKSYSLLNKEVEEANENHLPSVHSDGSEKIHEADPGSPDRKWKGSSSNRLCSDKSIHNGNASRNSINSENEREPFYNPMEEKPLTRGPSRVPSLEAESSNTVRMTSDSGISNDSSYDSVEGPKWMGRLTGGFKHKGFPQPPYQKDPLPNVSAPSKQSAVDRPSNEIESSYGEEYDRERHSQTYLSESRASSVLSDFSTDKRSESNYTAERRGRTDEDPSPGNSSGDIENRSFSHQKRESAKLEYSAYKSYGPRTQRQDSKGNSSESYSVPDFPSTPSKDNLDVTRPANPKQVVPDRERDAKTNMQSRLKMPFGYFDANADEADKSEPYHNVNDKSESVKLSRRTRALPSEGKRVNDSRSAARSDEPGKVEKRPQSNSASGSLHLERRGSSDSSQTKLSPEQPPVTPQAEHPKNKEIPKSSKLASVDSGAPVNSGIPKTSSSTEGLSSREDSLKASHVHPKLPDYESLAAHFHSLRANVRPQ